MKKNNGFTLLEFIIVIVLTGILSIVATKMLTQGLNAYITGQNTLDAQWQARISLEKMVRDIRSIRSPSDITTASSNQIVFTDSSGTGITYTVSGNTLTRNGQGMADGINALTLSYLDKNGTTTAILSAIRYITIQINTTLNTTNYTLSTSVYPRNSP